MFPKWSPTSEDDTPRDFNATMGTLRTDLSLAASVKYFCALLLLWVSADSYSRKIHVTISHVGQHRPSLVGQMSGVPPESPHVGDRMGKWHDHNPTQEST